MFFHLDSDNLQSSSRLKISVSVEVGKPLLHDFGEHWIRFHFSHFGDDPSLSEEFTFTKVLNTIVDVVHGQEVWNRSNRVFILDKLISVSDTALFPETRNSRIKILFETENSFPYSNETDGATATCNSVRVLLVMRSTMSSFNESLS